MDHLLPQYNTKLFTDVFPDDNSFKALFVNANFKDGFIHPDYLITLYYLLYARYGANPIANLTENLFKAKIISIVWCKGPTWVKRLSLQKSLRDLTDAELLSGAKTIFNRALHPETEPGTDTDTELTYINAQDVSKIKRSKIDAYSYLNDVLKNDVTKEFIDAFAELFCKFVSPSITHIYENDIEDDEED